MRLNLGCCDTVRPGFLGVDRVPPADIIADLTQPWPWPDSSVEMILAHDIIEHLPDKLLTMNEMWRVLAPGGIAEIIVPEFPGSGAVQDPTHVSYWTRRSFKYYTYQDIYRDRFAKHYGIRAAFKVLQEKIEDTQDGPKLTMVLGAVK